MSDDATHGPGTLARPETIRPGDLIWYSYDWNRVTSIRVESQTVFVFFGDRAWGGRPEWKPYDRAKRARVRRALHV